MGILNLFNSDLAKTLNLPRTLNLQERVFASIAVKDVFAKVGPTVQSDVYQHNPQQWILTVRITIADRLLLFDMEDDAAIVQFRDDATDISYVWIEKVETIARIPESIRYPWLVNIYLVEAPSAAPPPAPYRILLFGAGDTGNRVGWNATQLFDALDIPNDLVAAGNPLPDLTPYGLVIIDNGDVHGAFTAGEIAAITYHVETMWRHLIVLCDTETGANLAPINQVAGIWGNAFGGGVFSHVRTISAGQSGHHLWTTPAKGAFGMPVPPNIADNCITTVDASFTKYADLAAPAQFFIYREFDTGAKVAMLGYDGLLDFDSFTLNHIDWMLGLKAIAWQDDFEDTVGWVTTVQAVHDLSIVGGTFMRIRPIANAAGWSAWTTAQYNFPSEHFGDFALLMTGRFDAVVDNSIWQYRITAYDSSNNVVVRLYLVDSWAGSAGSFRTQICASTQASAAGSMINTDNYRVSFVRSSGTIDFTSDYPTVGSGHHHRAACALGIDHIIVEFRHYATYWNANQYCDIDIVTFFD